MGTLASIGRARPSRSMLGLIQAKHGMVQDERSALITESNLALNAERIEQVKRQNATAKQEFEEGETPMAIETFASKFEGGEDGPMFKMVYDMANKAGYVDTIQGGLGVIKKRYLPEIAQLISDPTFASKLSRTRIDYWRGKRGEVANALKEKPDDQKLQGSLEQINAGLNQALFQDDAMTKHFKAEAEARKQTEIERRNLETEKTARITARTTGKGKPTDFENIYQELKLLSGNENLTRLDVKKDLAKKNIAEMAVGLAQRNIDVMSGAATLADKATEILTILNRLKGESGKTKPPTRKEAVKFLKDSGMPATDANIKYFMENY